MGSDLSMNPPRPASYAVLASVGLGAVAVYKLPGEMERDLSPGVWHRVHYVHFNNDEMKVREAAVTTAKALGQRVIEVTSDAAMERVINSTTMHDLMHPKPPTYKAKHA